MKDEMQVTPNVEGSVQPRPLVEFVDPNAPKEKEYLILIVGTDENGDEFKDFEFISGRDNAYFYIKGLVENIDLYESKIIAANDIVNNAKPVVKFMKYCIDEGLIEDPGFDITDYLGGEED